MAVKRRRRKGRMTPAQARAARRVRRKARRAVLRTAALVTIGGIALIFVVSLFAPSLPISIGSSASQGAWIRVPDQGALHIAPGEEHPPYNSTPATSGWHYGEPDAPTSWGRRDEPIADEILVHNLEHGGVGIHYDCPDGCPELVDQLAEIADRAGKVVLSPYPGLDTTIALTAWNYIDAFDAFDATRIEDFIKAHLDSGNAPESGVR